MQNTPHNKTSPPLNCSTRPPNYQPFWTTLYPTFYPTPIRPLNGLYQTLHQRIHAILYIPLNLALYPTFYPIRPSNGLYPTLHTSLPLTYPIHIPLPSPLPDLLPDSVFTLPYTSLYLILYSFLSFTSFLMQDVSCRFLYLLTSTM